jgi:hypothetical protein
MCPLRRHEARHRASALVQVTNCCRETASRYGEDTRWLASSATGSTSSAIGAGALPRLNSALVPGEDRSGWRAGRSTATRRRDSSGAARSSAGRIFPIQQDRLESERLVRTVGTVVSARRFWTSTLPLDEDLVHVHPVSPTVVGVPAGRRYQGQRPADGDTLTARTGSKALCINEAQ